MFVAVVFVAVVLPVTTVVLLVYYKLIVLRVGARPETNAIVQRLKIEIRFFVSFIF